MPRPLALNSATSSPSRFLIWAVARTAASWVTSVKIFFSASVRRFQTCGAICVTRPSTMWPVSMMCFCTSKNFLASIVVSGFSWASTVPFCSAR